jgi:enamine deaminase RidA (YjgF/YER057c/UK114 family)
MTITVLQPAGWAPPKGYANGVAATGLQVFVAGQIGWNAQCVFDSDDLVAQVRQALANVKAVLAEKQRLGNRSLSKDETLTAQLNAFRLMSQYAQRKLGDQVI